MSDETTNTGAEDAAAAEGAGQEAPNVRLVSHYIRDLSFENVAAQEGTQPQGQPEIAVSVNLDAAGINETRVQVGMQVEAKAKAGDKTRFLVELDYVGVFDMINIPKEHMHPALFVECPRLLLPYARRVISDVTRDGGYPPLMLDNVDFGRLYQSKMSEFQTQHAAATGGDAETADA